VAERSLRADARRNREAIIAAARSVVEEGRFFELRFDDFAERAGVGTGTLYRHFPTRGDLAAAVYLDEVLTLSEHARELSETLPAGKALEAFLRDVVSHIRAHEGFARALSSLMADGQAGDTVTSSQPLEDAVATLVAAAAAEGSIRRDVRAGALMMALHSIGASGDRPDWRAETDDLITLVIAGLHSKT